MLKKIIIALFLLIFLVGCSDNPNAQTRYEADIGVRVDGTAKLPVNVNAENKASLKRAVLDDYTLPIDFVDPDTLYDLKIGDTWLCTEEETSSLNIVMFDKARVKLDICLRGLKFTGWVHFLDLQRTLVTDRKFYIE